jgi:hypothetical protein
MSNMEIKSIIEKHKQNKVNPEARKLAEAIVFEALQRFVPQIVKQAEDIAVIYQKIHEEVQKIKKGDSGEAGYTPRRGVDYFTRKDIEDLTPKKGKDYLTRSELEAIKEEITPKKGEDYFDGEDAEMPDFDEIVAAVLGKIRLPKDGKDGSPDTPEEIVAKLNTLDEALDMKVIKGLNRWMTEIKNLASKKSEQRMGGGGGSSSSGGATKSMKLNSQLNGVTKDFVLPNVSNVISVHASSGPSILSETDDYTWTSDLISFTSQVDASTTLAAGQTVVVVYTE